MINTIGVCRMKNIEEKSRLNEFCQKIVDKLENKKIVDHLLKADKMEKATWDYFHYVCPVVKAIVKDVEHGNGKLFVAPEGKETYFHSGTGSTSVKFKHIHTEYIGNKANEDTTVALEVDVYLYDREEDRESNTSFWLYVPIALFSYFTQKAFDNWANLVKEIRETKEKKEDLETIEKLSKKWKIKKDA